MKTHKKRSRKINIEINKLCSGCNSLVDYNGTMACFYIVKPMHDTIECPCVKCLVKCSCTKVCNEFNVFLTNYSSLWYVNNFGNK